MDSKQKVKSKNVHFAFRHGGCIMAKALLAFHAA